jgi:putative NADPH-quinone reductase
MKILLVACSPRRPSLGHTLALRLRSGLGAAGLEPLWHELYEEGFPPVLDEGELSRGYSLDERVQEACRQLGEADGLLIVHPDWWGGPPAILKGWIDRVFRQGVAYELEGEDGTEKAWRGLLGGKKARVYITTDSSEARRVESLRRLWVEDILGPCGFEAGCDVLGQLRQGRASDRAAWIEKAVEEALAAFGATRPDRP